MDEWYPNDGPGPASVVDEEVTEAKHRREVRRARMGCGAVVLIVVAIFAACMAGRSSAAPGSGQISTEPSVNTVRVDEDLTAEEQRIDRILAITETLTIAEWGSLKKHERRAVSEEWID